MPKNPVSLAPDLRPNGRRSKVVPIASIFVIAPLLAPLILEAGALCYAQWCAALGTSAQVRTPIIDTIQEGIETVRNDLWSALSARFQRVPWSPTVVLPVAAVIMAVAMVMLRL
jgi:hypothetical protein